MRRRPVAGRNIAVVLAAVSLVLSAAALAVAGFSIYIVSLRHANIEVDATSAEVRHSSATGHLPTASALAVTLLASNDGARAALLESIRIVAIEPNVDIWGFLQGTGTPGSMPFPTVLQANEARSYSWVFGMANQTSEDPVAFEQFVSNVERLTSIEIAIEWSYHRSSGLPFNGEQPPVMAPPRPPGSHGSPIRTGRPDDLPRVVG